MKEYIKDKAKKLILPYLWMSFLVFPLWYVTYYWICDTSTTLFQVILGIFGGNNLIFYTSTSNALWFLLVLFFAEILYAAVVKWTHGDEQRISIFVILSAIVGYLEKGKGQIWHFNIAFTAVAFLYIGKLLMDFYRKHTEFFESKREIKKYGMIFLLMIVGGVSHICNGRISMTANKFGKSFVLFYITAFCFSVVVILVAMSLPRFHFLNYIGRNTLLYVGCHIPVIRFFEKAYPNLFSSGVYVVFLAVGVYLGMMLICWLCNKYFPYVCGKTATTNRNVLAIWKVFIVADCGVIPVLGIFEHFHILEKSSYQNIMIVCLTFLLSIFYVWFSQRKPIKK